MSHTGNPRAPQLHPDDAPHEPTGAVAKDSLAAESINAGEGFSENPNAQTLGVKGGSSTLNNTDTSGATVLHAATSGAAREKQDALGAGSDERGVSGVKYPEGAPVPEFSGSINTLGYSGGPSSGAAGDSASSGAAAGASDFGAKTTTSSSTDDDGYTKVQSSGNKGSNTKVSGSTGAGTGVGGGGATAGVKPYVDKAPTYAARVAGNLDTEGQMQPKGENLTEGGIPETKTFTGDVGGPHDPGRLAEKDFGKANAAAGADTEPTQSGSRNKPGEGSTGQYDVLSSERA